MSRKEGRGFYSLPVIRFFARLLAGQRLSLKLHMKAHLFDKCTLDTII
ncbi:MAG: hypothetical protein ACLPVI_05755 [Dehalococcoidales bacterium]